MNKATTFRAKEEAFTTFTSRLVVTDTRFEDEIHKHRAYSKLGGTKYDRTRRVGIKQFRRQVANVRPRDEETWTLLTSKLQLVVSADPAS